MSTFESTGLAGIGFRSLESENPQAETLIESM